MHLLYNALKQESEDLSGATFRCNGEILSSERALFDERILSVERDFEILKNDQSIGTFNFKYNYKTRIATLKKGAENNAGFEYTYNLNNEQITSQEINN